MKTDRSNPNVHAARGDERIRTAVPALGTDWAYEALAAGERKRHELYGDLLRGKVEVKEYVAAVMQAVDEWLARAEADRG